jgi:hypothetical protein
MPAKRGNVAVVEVEPEGFGVELVGELATRLDHLEDPVHAGRVDAVEVDGMGVGPGPPVLLGHLEDGNAQHPGRPVSREDVGREEVPAGAGVVGVVAVGAVDLVLPQRALVHRVLLVGGDGVEGGHRAVREPGQQDGAALDLHPQEAGGEHLLGPGHPFELHRQSSRAFTASKASSREAPRPTPSM